MRLLIALLLVEAPPRSTLGTWDCVYHTELEDVFANVSMSFWGPNDPILPRPSMSIALRRFSYDWKPVPRLLHEAYRDPAALSFPLRTERRPVAGTVVLTAPGEPPIRIAMGRKALGVWDVWHGPYLQVEDRRATARLLSVPRWTATLRDRRGRVQEVATLAPPARAELRVQYDAARGRMIEAARDPANSEICEIDRTEETI